MTHRSQEMSLLQTEKLTKHFGGLSAVDGLDMTIKKGEILALIGPNGAGKTTVYNLITGFLRPTKGRIIYEGEDITRLKPHQITRKGIVRSFQANILFMEKTARENVLLGFHIKYESGFLKEILNTKAYREERKAIEKKADQILDFLRLSEFRDQQAKNLTHGYQRMLGVAVALAPEPDLLLLDEPVAGLNDEETSSMMGLIRGVRDRGISILLVEHDMKAVMGNCERIIVLNYGKMIAEGTPSEVVKDQKVIEAYLGTGEFNA